MKKIFILLGHPNTDTFTGMLADEYERGAREAGHQVLRVNLGECDFDPILHKGYKEIQELEPDLLRIQRGIKEADHFVLFYPNWWNTMPALLKGFFDRAWLPGFAFNFDKSTKKLIQRLKGKSARVFIVAGTHSPMMTWLKFGDYTNEVREGILKFSGFEPVHIETFGPCERCGEPQRQEWIREVFEMGKNAS